MLTRNLSKVLLVGSILLGGNTVGNCSVESTEDQSRPLPGHTMLNITGQTFYHLDPASQSDIIKSFISVFSDPNTLQTIINITTGSNFDVPAQADIQKLPFNIAILVSNLQNKLDLEKKMKNTDSQDSPSKFFKSLNDTAENTVQGAIYDEDGRFLDDDLRHAQEEISLLIDYAHRSCPIGSTLEKILNDLDAYYKDEGRTAEFIECVRFVINNIRELDLSSVSEETSKRLRQLKEITI